MVFRPIRTRQCTWNACWHSPQVCLLSELSSVGTKSARQMEQGFVFMVLILHINQVLKGHLLKAGQLVPLRGCTDCVEGEVRFEDVSNQLTAGSLKCVHGNRVELKFDI